MLSTAFSSGQMTTYAIFGKFLLLSSLFVTFAFKRNSLSKGQFIVSDLAILS